ncbi:hypothetical protein [Mycobacteroides chelonae]|nr:hypothetical protein Chelonae_p1052 [Mycobacterium sp. QIA-37]
MPASLALNIFHRLLDQVAEIEAVATHIEADQQETSASILRRSAYVLAVAALDFYFHERGIELLAAYAKLGAVQAGEVANYVKSVSACDVAGPQGESHIRLRLSFKTLASPSAIDSLLTTAGHDTAAIWLSVAFALNNRPDRLRRLSELVYDRRNQIAHEADWDLAQLDFRPMGRANLSDCVDHVRALVEAFDSSL